MPRAMTHLADRAYRLMLAAVGVVLLIACVNVALVGAGLVLRSFAATMWLSGLWATELLGYCRRAARLRPAGPAEPAVPRPHQ